MKKEILVVVISFLLLIISFSGCISDSVTAEEIKERFLQATENVNSYCYSASGIISDYQTNENGTLPSNSSFYSNSSVSYTLVSEVDISNRQLKSELNQFLKGNQYNLTCYFENETLYSSFNFTPLEWLTHKKVNDWYAFSYLDRQIDFIIEGAEVDKLDDDIVDSVDCYVLNISPVIDNLSLNQSFMDLLFSSRSYNSSFYKRFSEDYHLDIKYWIDKDTYLLKKIYIKDIYTVIRSFDLLDEPMTLVRTAWCETDIVFYDYNFQTSLESPWQVYIDEAEAMLSHLEYSDTRYGFGLNPPQGWQLLDLAEIAIGTMGGSIPTIFRLENEDYSNLSFSIGPPSQFNKENLSAQIEECLENIDEYYATYGGVFRTYDVNFSLDYHGEITVNGMNAYEFVTSDKYPDRVIKEKEICVEKDGRIFTINIRGYSDLFDAYEPEIEQNINSSFTIIAPYFEIYNL